MLTFNIVFDLLLGPASTPPRRSAAICMLTGEGLRETAVLRGRSDPSGESSGVASGDACCGRSRKEGTARIGVGGMPGYDLFFSWQSPRSAVRV
jgi:hypothetical protein